MTTAQQIAAYCGNDGTRTRWWADEIYARGGDIEADYIDYDGGVYLSDICKSYGASYTNDWDRELVVYLFGDGSAIVESGGAWDVRPDNCAAQCWAGVGCMCDK